MFRFNTLAIPAAAAALALALAACGGGSSSTTASAPSGASSPNGASTPNTTVSAQDSLATLTPIKHLVVIFGENRSFDHYFGTYPNAANPAGEPMFKAAAGTPTPVNLNQNALLTNNPNLNPANNAASAGSSINPFRLDRTQANTNGQNHSYTPEQEAYDNGAADLFPKFTGNNSVGSGTTFGKPGLVLGFYDGNTVTGMWNYAQNFALNDNAYTDTYGPSTPGAVEVISGQNNGIVPANGAPQSGSIIADGAGSYTLIGDTDPTGDVCSTNSASGQGKFGPNNKNIGDLLNAKNITWGGFMGGFDTTAVNANGTTGCKRTTFSTVLGGAETDYVPHHNWFQYYDSTANLAHTRPTSTALVGFTDPKDSTSTPVHHEYDVNDFVAAVSSGNFPSVSYIKAPAVGDAHPGNSDPLDEQAFVVNLVNFIEQQPDWKNTAIIMTYDDSDGWYDHRYATPTSSSFDTTADQLTSPGVCGSTSIPQGVGVTGSAVNGRCGPGTRIPFLVISPWAKQNVIDDTQISQSSVVKFIEDNWLGSTRIGSASHDATAGSIMNMFDFTKATPSPALILDPNTGEKVSS